VCTRGYSPSQPEVRPNQSFLADCPPPPGCHRRRHASQGHTSTIACRYRPCLFSKYFTLPRIPRHIALPPSTVYRARRLEKLPEKRRRIPGAKHGRSQ